MNETKMQREKILPVDVGSQRTKIGTKKTRYHVNSLENKKQKSIREWIGSSDLFIAA